MKTKYKSVLHLSEKLGKISSIYSMCDLLKRNKNILLVLKCFQIHVL